MRKQHFKVFIEVYFLVMRPPAPVLEHSSSMVGVRVDTQERRTAFQTNIVLEQHPFVHLSSFWFHHQTRNNMTPLEGILPP